MDGVVTQKTCEVLSYFGLAENSGFIRITCSGHQTELVEMMNRLESCLLQSRQDKHRKLVTEFSGQLNALANYDKDIYETIKKKTAAHW